MVKLIHLLFLCLCMVNFSCVSSSFILSSDGFDCQHGILSDKEIRKFRNCLPGNVFFINRGRRCVFLKTLRRPVCPMLPETEGNFICSSYNFSSCEDMTSTELNIHPETTPATVQSSTDAKVVHNLETLASITSCPPCLPCTQAPISLTSTIRPNYYRHYRWLEMLK